MSSLIEFKLDDGSTLLVEGVDDSINEESYDRSYVSAGDDDSPVTQAEKSLTDSINIAKSAAEKILESFKEMNSPDEIQLQFGVKMAAKAGVIIASANTEANFQVSLKWEKPKQD